MRTFLTGVVLLLGAVFLALPGGLRGDEPKSPPSAPACCQAGLASLAAYDTSVYHLEHVRAHDVIGAVRDAVFKSLTRQAAEKKAAPQSFSLVLIPTTSDDSLVAICPREHAAAVKEAVRACDVVHRYAVKVQVFEVTKNGETIPAGAPALFVGRDGHIRCSTSANETVTLTVKVDRLKPAICGSAQSNPTDLCDWDHGTAATDKSPAACQGRRSCGSAHSSCPACPACTACPACRCGSCAGESCTGETAGHSCVKDECNAAAYEEQGEATLSQTGATSQSAGVESGTGKPAGCSRKKQDKAAGNSAEGCRGECESRSQCDAPDCPAVSIPSLSKVPGFERLFSIHRWTSSGGAPSCDACDSTDCPNAAEAGRQSPNDSRRAGASSTGDCDGCAHDVGNSKETSAGSQFVARLRSQGGAGSDTGAACRDGSEPPALLSLSPQKAVSQPACDIAAPPQWQSELWKSYRGRRLSEIFEPASGHESIGGKLGRLVAEIPKHSNADDADHPAARGLIVVDLPDRVRIFENASPAAAEKGAAAEHLSCREEFHAFLEELFQGSAAPGDLTPVGHRQADSSPPAAPLDLPNFTHSKIETVVVTYPLQDLVLLDDSGHPVFDTCTIIDHIQSAVAPESWSHPRVSIQLDQHNVSLVIRQTPEVHAKIEAHLQYLRRLQIKQICNVIERMSGGVVAAAPSRNGKSEPAGPVRAEPEPAPAAP